MLYLIDSNVLINANRDYYPIDRVPEFWGWLVHMGELGFVKIPIEVYEELKKGNDGLGDWLKKEEIKNALLFNEEVAVVMVRRVIYEGYAPDLTDSEVEQLGRDPFLIAYGLQPNSGRCLVTTENSKPSKQRANRHIPDVCDYFNIPCCDAFEFIHALGFRTDWETVYSVS